MRTYIRFRLAVLVASLSLVLVVAGCGGGGGGGTTPTNTTANNGTNNGGGNAITNPTNPGDGEGDNGNDTGGGGIVDEGEGNEPVDNGGGETAVPEIFYGKWAFRLSTLYKPDGGTSVNSMSGTAVFNRDGTYAMAYYIGSISNAYSGTYRINGDRIVLNDLDGNPVFTYELSVGTDPAVLVLVNRNADGSPSFIYSLVPDRE